MQYGYYEYFLGGKLVILIYKFHTKSVHKATTPPGEQYTYDLYPQKILLDYNSKEIALRLPRPLNLTYSQLEDWTSDNINDVVKVAIKNIFRKSTSMYL